MQEEQGFVNEGKCELIDYNYTAAKVLNFRQKKYTNKLKLISHFVNFQRSAFINRKLQNHISQSFVLKNEKNIVFNNFNRLYTKFDNEIDFDSNFEGGNLQFVLKKKQNEYQIYMKPDTNTKTHFQWFNFKMRNKKKATVKLTIKNFIKSSMLYTKGLKPYYKSLKQKHEFYEQIQSNIEFIQDISQQKYYNLKFTFQFYFQSDQIQICSQPPYNYSKLQKYLQINRFQCFQISRSLMGHSIDAILINDSNKAKALVVVIARQHPGQSVSSWMMEGFMNQLKQKQKDQIIWLIIPMVNVDGVILGNNRTGLLGLDFNRNWKIDENQNQQRILPEIVNIMRFLKSNKRIQNQKIKIFIDFHGHSSQPNVFSYGPPHLKPSEYYENSRLFPFLISKRNPNFLYNYCSFQIGQTKKYCARSIFLNKFGFPYSYTIESSFGIYQNKNINQKQFLAMGSDIFQSLNQFVLLLTSKKQNKKLKLLLEEVKSLRDSEINIEQFGSQNQDSDQQKPIRKQFEKKVSHILSNSQIYKQEIKKINCKLNIMSKSRKNRGFFNEKIGDLSLIDDKQTKKRMSNSRLHSETVDQIQFNSEQKIYLPKISHQRAKQSINHPLNKKRTVTQVDLDQMTMQQLKERLFSLKNSKLGRKILVFNAYSNVL